jgi:3',5'-cyclic AMP phosphodiesterase CpdA
MSSLDGLITRREMLRISAAGLVALGLGRATSRAAEIEHEEVGEFSFAVLNDLHFRDERCRPWCEAIARAIRSHGAEFCVINGDISENGQSDQLVAVREIFAAAGLHLRVTIGNHDHLSDDSQKPFEEVFPNSLNYHFKHRGWQFVALDSTQGQTVFYTRVQKATLLWLDENLPSLDRARPMILLTHFPLGPRVLCRPRNAPEVLARFEKHNLRAIFNGHWHGYSEREIGATKVVTNRCCSWWRNNNDGSPLKGYFLCKAMRNGEIHRSFHVIAPRGAMTA